MRLVNDQVTVRVPATSANLGPGYDSYGLALSMYNEVSMRATTGSTRVQVRGVGAGELPDGEDNLIVRALRAGLDYLDVSQVGVDMVTTNRIPQGAGLGSSAAAIVAGLSIARGLVGPEAMSDQTVFQLATELEGHPDNVAPAVFGGATFAWITTEAPKSNGTAEQVARVVRVEPPETIKPTVLVPPYSLATRKAREALPRTVAHPDAAFNVGRAGLLALVMAGVADTRYLFEATEDKLHQDARAECMPASHALVTFLREQGMPAVISGAGPTVLILGELSAQQQEDAAASGWRVHRLDVCNQGTSIEARRKS
ncbi:homoserine kinase [Gleimia hominis]|uniref:homoserine kinase n=1 Tax=Gleimia hominis TaxID=595468 RepID=UPI000C7FD21D|nr:homoserine kinase [Gleimia hominis]WIK64819.1 homoserine kinase [Gleimia hominis]